MIYEPAQKANYSTNTICWCGILDRSNSIVIWAKNAVWNLRSIIFRTGFREKGCATYLEARLEVLERWSEIINHRVNTRCELIIMCQRWSRRYLFPDDRLPSSVPQHWKTSKAQTLARPLQYSRAHAVFIATKLLCAYWVTDNSYLLGHERKTKKTPQLEKSSRRADTCIRYLLFSSCWPCCQLCAVSVRTGR